MGVTLLIGLMAIVIDVGWMYYNHQKLQTAVNAGWKAGFDRMMALTVDKSAPITDKQKAAVVAHIRDVVLANGFSATQADAVNVEFAGGRQLKVFSTQPVGLFFARFLDFNVANVSAERNNSGGAENPDIVPLAIPHGVVRDLSQHKYSYELFTSGEGFKEGREYILKLGEGKSTELDKIFPGLPKNCYGPVDPDNVVAGGASSYENRLKYGFNGPLQVNDRIIPEFGNMVGPSEDGVEFRLEQALIGKKTIIVPITDVGPEIAANDKQNVDAKTIYDLQGSDSSDGVYDASLYDFESAVRIIGFAEFEVLDPEDYTRAGSDIYAGDNGDLGSERKGQIRGKFVRYIIKPGEQAVN
jgi:hypothetical protein